MSKIISRMLVLGLLVSFVQAQQPSRDIDKDAHKATKDVKKEAKKAPEQDNKGAGDREHRGRLQDVEADALSSVGTETKVSSDKKGAKGVTKGSPNMAPSSRVSGDRQLAGTKNTSASGKAVKKGGFSRIFSRIFGGGGAEKVDGGKSGAVQPAGDGQDQPSSGQGQRPKGDKGAPAPKPQDNGGG